MTPLDYDYLRKLLRERSGLVLSADKQYLVESRLLPVARRAGLAGLSDLVQRLRDPNAERLAVEVVEAMTTNESFFFRDKIPFQHFDDTMMPATGPPMSKMNPRGTNTSGTFVTPARKKHPTATSRTAASAGS